MCTTVSCQLLRNTFFFSGILLSFGTLPVEFANTPQVLKEKKFCSRWKISYTVVMTSHCANRKETQKNITVSCRLVMSLIFVVIFASQQNQKIL